MERRRRWTREGEREREEEEEEEESFIIASFCRTLECVLLHSTHIPEKQLIASAVNVEDSERVQTIRICIHVYVYTYICLRCIYIGVWSATVLPRQEEREMHVQLNHGARTTKTCIFSNIDF